MIFIVQDDVFWDYFTLLQRAVSEWLNTYYVPVSQDNHQILQSWLRHSEKNLFPSGQTQINILVRGIIVRSSSLDFSICGHC